ncbi:MAG: ATP-dependent helicase [Chthoniobacterales bacterium]|nr:ATP-dependent helicase [Chthoniobacterales bacterium]
MQRSYQLQPSSTALDYRAALNEQQYAAVTSPAGAALVIAGAGSGKTRTLTYRVSWLLEQGYAAEQILLLTFTNKAAREMLDRVNHLLPGRAAQLWGGTFHSIGYRILRRHPEQLGFQKNFTIMDRDDQEELLESIISREGFRSANKQFPKANVLADIISYSVNTGKSLTELLRHRYPYFIELEEALSKIVIAYEAGKKAANAMDFDDLLSKTHLLMVTHPEIARLYQHQFRAVLVDEYQDTNLLQASLIDLLAAHHQHVMVVGDDAQSIYSWRGANVANILEFPKRYPKAQLFPIETNYRSVPQILKLANASLAFNTNQFPKELQAARPSHVIAPALVPLSTNNEQASFVAQRILELHDEGIPFSEMAVLYRAHYHSMEVQLELTRRGIPFFITSGLRFFEQAHIKDVAAVMKFALNPNDEVAFKRFIQLLPGIGKKTAEALWLQTSKILRGERHFSKLMSCKAPTKAAKEWKQLVHTLEELAPETNLLSPSELIRIISLGFYDEIMKEKFPNYDSRREDLMTLMNYGKQFSDTAEFLAQLTLLGEGEQQKPLNDASNQEGACLSSIHQAKGLEWRAVFLVWLTEGMFPSGRSLENEEALEEERRLFYVAVTRCKEELYLTYPELRLNANYGEAFQRPSRFLSELSSDLYEKWDVTRR